MFFKALAAAASLALLGYAGVPAYAHPHGGGFRMAPQHFSAPRPMMRPAMAFHPNAFRPMLARPAFGRPFMARPMMPHAFMGHPAFRRMPERSMARRGFAPHGFAYHRAGPFGAFHGGGHFFSRERHGARFFDPYRHAWIAGMFVGLAVGDCELQLPPVDVSFVGPAYVQYQGVWVAVDANYYRTYMYPMLVSDAPDQQRLALQYLQSLAVQEGLLAG